MSYLTMIYWVFAVIFMADGSLAQLHEIDSCDPNELKTCVHQTPKTPVGLPRTKDELDAHSELKPINVLFNIIMDFRKATPDTINEMFRAYKTGMTCMDTWIKRCLPTDGQKLVQQQIGGARALMRFLCTNDTALRNEFLKEPTCWSIVSPDWSHCVDELQTAVRDISERTQLLAYFNKNSELCCARDAFMTCVTNAGRSCSPSASNLLRRMAWVLAQDVAACNQGPKAYCAASGLDASILVLVISVVLLMRNSM